VQQTRHGILDDEKVGLRQQLRFGRIVSILELAEEFDGET
jgi:hypothetical protein